MNGLLERGPAGWLRDGIAWTPDGPFYGVVGDPIAHSLSPRMQQAGLDERGLGYEYLAIRLDAGQLAELKKLPDHGGLQGFNVTAPHKELAATLCDELTPVAAQLEAVNTVKVLPDGRWHGHNTDCGGVESVLVEAFPGEERPALGTVLGTGGSARAAVLALVRWGAERVVVQAHSAGGLEKFEEWIARNDELADVAVEALPADRPDAPVVDSVWIACLAGEADLAAYLPVAAGRVRTFLLDLRYGTQADGFTAPLGFSCADGLPVLLMQGVLSFAWWFGAPIPLTKMRAALAR